MKSSRCFHGQLRGCDGELQAGSDPNGDSLATRPKLSAHHVVCSLVRLCAKPDVRQWAATRNLRRALRELSKQSFESALRVEGQPLLSRSFPRRSPLTWADLGTAV